MFSAHARIAGLLFAVMFVSSLAWGQANVNETLETAQVYVDGVHGSDTNPGTINAPLQTIGAAVTLATANNHNNIGTQVIINPGTYRESVSLGYTAQDTSWPITFQAATNGTVIVSGADVWSGWQAYSPNPNVFTNAWPYQWGLCGLDGPGAPFEQTILLRREMIFVNGSPLTQVLALSSVATPGTFFVDESGGQVYIWPPTGTDMNTATVEVATRPHPLSVYSKNQLVFRGLTFQYANSCRNDYVAQVFGASTNIVFDSDSFIWNNGHGLTLSNPAANITVENTVANHNGQLGFSDSANKSVLWQNVQASYNNWRGSQGSYYFWGSAGAYFGGEHNGTINGFTSNFNQTNGIHWDTDTVNANVTGLFSSDNVLNGAFIEKNEGPMNISASTFCNNNFPQVFAAAQFGGGVTWRDSEQITLTNSIMYNNGVAQIDIQGTPGGIPITNWETLVNYNLVTQNLTSTHNTLDAVGPTQQAFVDNYLGGSDWTAFVTTLISNNNNYWNAANTSAFAVPMPIGGTQLDFAGWQVATGQDAPGSGSSFSAPLVDPSVACAVTPDYPDYWLLVDNPALTLSLTGSATYNVSVVPVGSFNSTVNLTFDGVSEVSGLSAGFNSSSIIGSGTSAFTVNAVLGTPAGTYPVTVMANSGGVTHTTTFSLIVPNTSVRLSTATVAFPPQQINTTGAPLTFTITNGGSAALPISSIVELDAGNSFAQTNNCLPGLAPGASCTVTVTFTPFAAQVLTGTITIIDSDPASPQVVNLTGTGLGAPTAVISPFGLFFGNQEVGSTSAPQAMVVTNSGTAALNVSSVAVTGANPGDFRESDNCTAAPIAVNSSCTITVTFSPTATQNRNATVIIADNGPGSPQKPGLAGSGTQPIASLLPSPLTFINQQVGQGQTQTITLANFGSAPMNITAITIAGANAADFTQTSNCPAQIANGGSCTVSVTFTPSATVAETANLIVTDDAPGSPHVDMLNGTGVTPIATFSPSSFAFGNQMLGVPIKQTITLTNTGSTSLQINNMTVTGPNAPDFVLTAACGQYLTVGGTCNLNLNFTPTVVATESASVLLTDTALNSPQTISATGTGVVPVAVFSPTSLAFGNQLVGTSSAPQAVTLTNTGGATLNVYNMNIIGTNSFGYTQTNNCGSSLAANASCTVNVVFSPLGTTSGSPTLDVNDNAAGSPQTVTLTGQGTQPTVQFTPFQLAMGNQQVGTTSPVVSGTLTNTGTGQLNISSVSVTGPNAGEFTQTNTCGSTVAPGASCTISAKFIPAANGLRSGDVTFITNAPGQQMLPLVGTGVTPIASQSTYAQNFGTQNVGTSSPTQQVIITNTGTGPLVISSISVTGATSDYTQTNNCTTLGPNQPCAITVTFTPTVTGTRNAYIDIYDNAAGSPQGVSLTGTGTMPGLNVSPGSLVFGNQLKNTASAPQTVTLSNTGSGLITITSINITGADAPWFALNSSCGTSLAPNGECRLTITFTPLSAVTASPSLNINVKAPAISQVVALSGTGTQPIASFAPPTLGFGNQIIKTTSAAKTVTLTNSGTGPMTISTITVTGANAQDFSQTNNCPASLAAGAACTFTVTFTPPAATARSASITITDTAQGSPHTVPLSGTGTTAVISLSPTTLTYAGTNIGTSAPTQEVTVTNTGTGTVTINSITISGANPGDFTQSNTCGTSVNAGRACTITVTFTPTAVASRKAAVTISDNATGSPNTVTLAGTGTQPTVNLSPSPLSMGNQNLATTGTGTITLTNTGTGSLTGISVSVTGPNSAEFTQTNTCKTSVNAGATCTFTIKFTPTATGTRSATLNITDNAPASPQTVSLSGTGTQPTVSLSPSPLSMGNQNVATTGTATITLTNTGTGSLTGISVSITGANSAEFTETDTCKPSVNAGSTCTFTIKFTPVATGARSATLKITDNAPGGSQTVALNGTGTQPLISLSTNSLTFPPQTVGTTSAPMTVTVTNPGTGVLTVTSISFTGLNANWFAQTNTCGSSLAAGANCTISVTVTPKAHSTVSPSLNIVTNAPGSPNVVALSATGD